MGWDGCRGVHYGKDGVGGCTANLRLERVAFFCCSMGKASAGDERGLDGHRHAVARQPGEEGPENSRRAAGRRRVESEQVEAVGEADQPRIPGRTRLREERGGAECGVLHKFESVPSEEATDDHKRNPPVVGAEPSSEGGAEDCLLGGEEDGSVRESQAHRDVPPAGEARSGFSLGADIAADAAWLLDSPASLDELISLCADIRISVRDGKLNTGCQYMQTVVGVAAGMRAAVRSRAATPAE